VVNPQQPLISFTFDDFPRSALSVGGAILNRHGLTGTYYASLGLMGKSAPSGQIFLADDLKTLFQQGHELGCHTFSHCHSWEADSRTFADSIIENRMALSKLIPGAEFKTFAYPISPPRPMIKAKIASHFLSCRGAGQTFNVGKADLNQLSAYFLEQSRHNIQAVKEVIDRNRQVHGWLIFGTHDISDKPTPFGCTPEFLELVVQYAIDSGARILPVIRALEALHAPGCREASVRPYSVGSGAELTLRQTPVKSLVSILIPAFNAQEWLADTLRSALSQTWERKEIIVVDDGSTDNTLMIARQFESDSVRVVSQTNQGAAAARNTAFSISKGEYIQWLDADDLLAPDKIAKQMDQLGTCGSKRTLLSSAFGKFMYRWYRAKFVPTPLWNDQSPTDWLLRKMGQNLFMQTATWLVSRELAEAAGPWDTRLRRNDDDGEYFCRVLLASDGVRFVPEARVYYRAFGYDSLSYIGASDMKLEAFWLSMQLHIRYLRSLEDSPRSRAACLEYLQRNLIFFYPNRPDITREAQRLAADQGGNLRIPILSWKYSWIRVCLGWGPAKGFALLLRKIRWSLHGAWDKARFRMENRQSALNLGSIGVRADASLTNAPGYGHPPPAHSKHRP
jgi:glycosyltransferase involved in cell wall biosynthesis/peptidoglycan/xylan/chitin deacetylase (PgdA/CDA1 family)